MVYAVAFAATSGREELAKRCEHCPATCCCCSGLPAQVQAWPDSLSHSSMQVLRGQQDPHGGQARGAVRRDRQGPEHGLCSRRAQRQGAVCEDAEQAHLIISCCQPVIFQRCKLGYISSRPQLPPSRRTKVSLNVIAFNSTFKLIDQALEQGINLQEVRHSSVCWQSSRLPSPV